MRIVDISNPLAPRQIGQLDTPGWAGSVLIRGDKLYVADAPGGLRIVDIQDPSAMRELGAVQTAVRAYGLDVVGDRAYVAVEGDRAWVTQALTGPEGGGSVELVDLTDPAEPKLIANHRSSDRAWGAALDPDGRAYIAATGAGLLVLEESSRLYTSRLLLPWLVPGERLGRRGPLSQGRVKSSSPPFGSGCPHNLGAAGDDLRVSATAVPP